MDVTVKKRGRRQRRRRRGAESRRSRQAEVWGEKRRKRRRRTMKKMMKRRAAKLEEERRLKEMEGRDDSRTKISISNQSALKKSILHSRLCMREIVRRALIKESIM